MRSADDERGYLLSVAAGEVERLPRSSGGSVLLEVMVATLLVGLLVVPLAEGLRSAVERAHSARGATAAQVAKPRPGGTFLPGGDPWSWGAQVVRGWWQSGPELRLLVGCSEGEGDSRTLHVAVWIDGWCAQEETTAPGAPVHLGRALWQGSVGREVVVRVRTEAGAWGPPWRTQVPDAAGRTAGGPPRQGDQARDVGTGDPATLVVHMPQWGTSLPRVTVGEEPATPFASDGASLFPPGPEGWWRVETEGWPQWLLMRRGRVADVYF